MIPLIFFFADLIAYAIFDCWLIQSLLAYFIYIHIYFPSKRGEHLFALSVLLLEDYIMYGRFGLGFIYIIPVLLCCYIIRGTFYRNIAFFTQYLLLIGAQLIELFVIKKWLFIRNIEVQSTITKILINVVIITLIVFGRRGNRFLALLGLGRGKSGLQTGRMPYKSGFNHFK